MRVWGSAPPSRAQALRGNDGEEASYVGIPAKAGIHVGGSSNLPWMPACAGMTELGGGWALTSGIQLIKQVVPMRVVFLNQADFPVASPFLDAFFTQDGIGH